MIDPSVLSWSLYGFALFYWWTIYKTIRDLGSPEHIIIHPSFMIVGVMTSIFTVVNFVQSVWGHVLAQIQ